MHIFQFSVHNMQSSDIKYHKLANETAISKDETNCFCSDREVVPLVTAPGMEKGVSRDFGTLANGYSRPPQATLDLPCVK